MNPWLLLDAATPDAKELSLWERVSQGFSSGWEWTTQTAQANWIWLCEPTPRTVVAVLLGALGLWLMLPGALGRIWLAAPLARWCGCVADDGRPDLSKYTGLMGLIASAMYFFTTLYGIGACCALASWLILLSLLPAADAATMPVIFWILATMTLVSAVATITMQSPVYCAVWFGVTLLGTGGLFLIQGAQFLGVATVVVYAGAILVTFLFVLMLSQPEGHSTYDRMSWGAGPTAFAALAGVALAGLAITQVVGVGVEATPKFTPEQLAGGVLDGQHVARLGGNLFSVHLVAIEVAGTLLLAALVGAVAIAIQGKSGPSEAAEEPAHA